MLANRPGFPFLGNDLYALLGDLLAVHALDNPSSDSELSILTQYGPGIIEKYNFNGFYSNLKMCQRKH